MGDGDSALEHGGDCQFVGVSLQEGIVTLRSQDQQPEFYFGYQIYGDVTVA